MKGALAISAVAVAVAAILFQPAKPWEETEPAPTASLSRARTAFVPNLGQWDHPGRFVAQIGGAAVFLEVRGILVSLAERRPERVDPASPAREEPAEPVRGVAVRLGFAGAEVPALVPEQRLEGHHNYFLGSDPERWRTDVPRYGAVRYRGLWPGVDVVCYEKNGHLEYDVVLAPGADLEQVELTVEGADGLHLDDEGSLVIDTALGPLRQPRPSTWTWDRAGKRRMLAADYELRGKDRFGLRVPDWSGEWELVVDPGLVWSTFVGGSSGDAAGAMSVGSNGLVTLAGTTDSSNYPTTLGAFQSLNNFGRYDVFVTHFTGAQQQVLYSTYIGGTSWEGVTALAVDAAGVVTIGGTTGSTDYPTTSGAWDRTHNGFSDTFVTRLDPSRQGAQQLVWSTFLGGISHESLVGLSQDAAGVVTVAGWARSPDFPTTAGAWNTMLNGASDVFVTRLDPTLTGAQQVVYSTFLGGRLLDEAWAMSMDAAGVVTVAGWTDSMNFPTTPGAFDPTFNGGQYDAFVARLDASLPTAQQLVWSTYLGGIDFDAARSLAVDGAGVVTLAGHTVSADYPTSRGAFDPTLSPFRGDVFVTRLDPSVPGAQQLVYSTFLGGGDSDAASAVAVDAAGVITVAGLAVSLDFPTTPGALSTSFNGGNFGNGDAFVTRLDPSRPPAAQLIYSTYLGGAESEYVAGISVDPTGDVTIAGFTTSLNFPTTPGAFGAMLNGGGDAFVTRLDMLPTGVTGFGDSSPGCSGPLAIGVTSMPNVGNAGFSITCTGAPPNASGWLLAAAGGLTTPVQLLGARLWIDPNSAFLVTGSAASNAVGAADFPLPIPNDPSLVGFPLYVQYAWPSPCPPLGISASGALEIVVQP